MFTRPLICGIYSGMENLTPMLKQYKEIKTQYKDWILLFRLGDFYEMFYEDAKKASEVLNLVLTSRGLDNTGKVPMCGVPFHAADVYVARLIKAGLKVAICEQVEDPSLAKGIVKRQVIRQITTGTYVDDASYNNRYLVSLVVQDKKIGIALTDTTSGSIQTNEYADYIKAVEIIAKLPVYECLFPTNSEEQIRQIFKHPLLRAKNITLSPYQDWCFNLEISQKTLCEHFKVHNLAGFGIDEQTLAVSSSGALLEYLRQMNKQPLRHIDKISLYLNTEYVFISPGAIYGLELESLFNAIDHTITSMGKRKLKNWLFHPLNSIDKIEQRQEAISLLKSNTQLHVQLKQLLHNIPDIEKSITRISCGYGNFKDLLALRFSLLRGPEIQLALLPLLSQNSLFHITDIEALRQLLELAISPDIPIAHPEGKIIRTGYNQELDSLRDIQENGRLWLKKLQEEEIKRTRINSLKIGFNQVFGYYLEISKSNLNLVPQDYIRKQTLANAERFITAGLKEFEEKMFSAEEKVLKIENLLVEEIQKKVLDYSVMLHKLAQELATLDTLSSLSTLASCVGYCLPQISTDTSIIIEEGRHPVVEHTTQDPFISNDTLLDCQENQLLIITGPNMAGKSTYIRQVALLVILAQMGSFIPARLARIGIVDKIFTRIGAHDEISKGQSTFMVEMSETAGILNNLSSRSLVILDEIGRGTSTYDGLSLAWAVAEYLQKQKVRTLFATHFHELTSLAEQYPGVKNYNVEVKEWNDQIIFLHKIIPGGTDDSYGIYVAKLAGIPQEVIQRSKHLLSQLELTGAAPSQGTLSSLDWKNGKSPLVTEQIAEEIKSIDVDSITPLDALSKIQAWKEKLNKDG